MDVKSTVLFSTVVAGSLTSNLQAIEMIKEFTRVNGEPFVVTIPTHLDPEISEHCAAQYSAVKLKVSPIEIEYSEIPSISMADYTVKAFIGNVESLKNHYPKATEESIQNHARQLDEIINGVDNTQKPISILFDSPGGQPITANRLTEAILKAQYNGHPVSTITYGVSSAAIDPFIAGTEGRRTISYDSTDNINLFHQPSVDWGTGSGPEFTSDRQEWLDRGDGNFISRSFIRGVIADDIKKQEESIKFYIDNSTTNITYECAETLNRETDKVLATWDMLALGFADNATLIEPTKEKLLDLGVLEQDADRIMDMYDNKKLKNGVVIYRDGEQNPYQAEPSYTTLLTQDDVSPYVTPPGLEKIKGLTTLGGRPVYSGHQLPDHNFK